MSACLISDLHLQEQRPELTKAFKNFSRLVTLLHLQLQVLFATLNLSHEHFLLKLHFFNFAVNSQ